MFTPNDPQLTEAGSDSLRDPLTGALPKSAFEERLHAAASRALENGHAASLLVIDIDHFKSINDAFGHARGDAILREFARRLRIPLQTADSLFRFGGDEFVLLLAAADRREATAVAHRLLEEVECTPFAGDPPLSVSLSIGTATWPIDSREPGELFHRADLRLLEAKRRGRGQVASDDDSGESDKPVFAPLSRLVEREKAVESMYAFLRSLRSGKRGVLEVSGAAGAGRTRFLSEVASAGKLLGYEVLGITATSALGGRAHGMLVDPHPELEVPLAEGIEVFRGCLAERVRERGRAGLIVIVDDLPHADPASRELLRELLDDSPVGAVSGNTRFVMQDSDPSYISVALSATSCTNPACFKLDPYNNVEAAGFAKSLQLKLSYATAVGVNDPNELLVMFVSDRRDGNPEPQPTTVDQAAQTVTGSINHFSRYAIGSN